MSQSIERNFTADRKLTTNSHSVGCSHPRLRWISGPQQGIHLTAPAKRPGAAEAERERAALAADLAKWGVAQDLIELLIKRTTAIDKLGSIAHPRA